LRRVLLCLTVVVFAFGITAATATASRPHFKKNGSPVCTVSGAGTSSTSTVCSASLAGLGEETLVINVTVSGSAVYQCQNQGGNTTAGQNKVLVGPVTAPTTIPAKPDQERQRELHDQPGRPHSADDIHRGGGRLSESELDRREPSPDHDGHHDDDLAGWRPPVHMHRQQSERT
jgi:hypothetical protein